MPKKIKVNIFDDVKEALHDVAAHERGEPVNLRVTRIPRAQNHFSRKRSTASTARLAFRPLPSPSAGHLRLKLLP